MAEVLPKHHFAKLALGVALAGSLGSPLGWIYLGLALDFGGVDSLFLIIAAEAGVLAALVAFRPKLPETSGNRPSR